MWINITVNTSKDSINNMYLWSVMNMSVDLHKLNKGYNEQGNQSDSCETHIYQIPGPAHENTFIQGHLYSMNPISHGG